MTGPACGNNPNYRMTDGDRQAVVEFRAYLTRRAALLEAAETADELSMEIEQTMKTREVGPLTALQDLADKLRRMASETALSPYYEHPECGFHWHGRDGMDVPMRDGQPVCPRCELRRMVDETAATETQAPHRPVSLATPCAACTHPYNWHCGQPACQFGREGDLCGCRSFTPGEEPAAGARQDGAQP